MSVSDTDYDLLDKRLKAIEDSIVVIKGYIDTQLKNKYYPSTLADLTKVVRPYGALGETPCAFDGMSALDKMKPTGLVCNCPKCSPYCLSLGDLTDAGTEQQWRVDDYKSKEWVQSLKKFYKDLNLVGEMQYGGQFYAMCEAFGLNPEQVKKEIEND